MEQKRYKELEEKYWRGETTIFEEEELMSAFLNGAQGISSSLESVLKEKHELSSLTTDDSFETDFWNKIEDNEVSLTKWNKSKNFFLKMAAAVILILGSAVIWNVLDDKNPESAQTAQVEDSFDDPEKALEETKKALLFVSQKLNKGKEPVKEIQRFHNSKLTIIGADNEIDIKE